MTFVGCETRRYGNDEAFAINFSAPAQPCFSAPAKLCFSALAKPYDVVAPAFAKPDDAVKFIMPDFSPNISKQGGKSEIKLIINKAII